MKDIKVIIIHGNGWSTPEDHWIPSVKAALEKSGITVLAPQFPDMPIGRQRYWLPFLKDTLKADEHTVLIGHSTGAIAAMRFAEKNQILGTVLVAAYESDLGIESEKMSGYFGRPWNWDAIKNNQRFIIQFASTDDPFIPIEEARAVHKNLLTEYCEHSESGHFGGDYNKTTFPELVHTLMKKLRN